MDASERLGSVARKWNTRQPDAEQGWVSMDSIDDVASWWAVIYEGKPVNMFDVQEAAEAWAFIRGNGHTVVEFIPKPALPAPPKEKSDG